MKSSDYIYYTTPPPVYSSRETIASTWLRDLGKIAILFLLGFIISSIMQ